ncbi:MAG TPA: acetoin dehydrogenase dihydrolipoyllysine-residue acetyltransferase subunit [Thermoleophilaceae bacterium]
MSDRIDKLGMPKWGLSMTEGTVVAWLVEEGAELAVGDEVAEVETEKINGVVESPAPGVLRRRVAGVGAVVPVGGLLGVIADAAVPDADIDSFVEEFQAGFVPEEAEEEAGPAPETVAVEAGNLRFMRQGEGGEPLLLLHGFGGDLNNWLFTAPALAGEHVVYALDLPGHGGSSKDVGAGDLDFLARAVGQFMDSQELERAHLAGHSLGGLVAGSLALSAPERVGSLALVASAGLGDEINREYIEGFIAAERRRELKPVLELLFADPGLVTRQLVDDVLKYKRIDGVDEALRAIASGAFGEGGQRVVIADHLAELDVPVLVVWGREDRIIPAAHAERAPEGAQVHVLDGQGHSPHMEAAGDFNRIMERFLATAGAPAGS